jgi:hypothetical protein
MLTITSQLMDCMWIESWTFRNLTISISNRCFFLKKRAGNICGESLSATKRGMLFASSLGLGDFFNSFSRDFLFGLSLCKQNHCQETMA